MTLFTYTSVGLKEKVVQSTPSTKVGVKGSIPILIEKYPDSTLGVISINRLVELADAGQYELDTEVRPTGTDNITTIKK